MLSITLIWKPPSQQKPFIKLVEEILELTKSEDYHKSSIKQPQVKVYEELIDQMINDLHGLIPTKSL